MTEKFLRSPTMASGLLTPEEEVKLVAHTQLWIERAFRTKPIDHDKIIAAIKGIYAAAEKPEPRVIVVPSPLVMVFAYGLSSAILWGRKNPGSNLTSKAATRAATSAATEAATETATWNATSVATQAATETATAAATRAATRAATETATAAATRAATWNATSVATDAAIRAATAAATETATATGDATEAATWNATSVATQAATQAATREATWNATSVATRDATETATWNATAVATATQAATETATEAATQAATWAATQAATATWAATEVGAFIREFFSMCDAFGVDRVFATLCTNNWYAAYQGGNMWSGYDSYLSAARDILGLKLPEHAKYLPWEEAAINGGSRVMHEEFAMVCDFPELIRRDDRSRPHCDDGPSHRWRDGWSLFNIHGVSVTEKIVMRPDEITLNEIETEQNAEIRRIMVERYGYARYLRDAGLTLIEERPETDPIIGLRTAKLWRDDVNQIVLIDMLNSTPEPDGSTKRYVLPIDAGAYGGRAGRECLAAMASTWRRASDYSLFFKSPEDYQPIAES